MYPHRWSLQKEHNPPLLCSHLHNLGESVLLTADRVLLLSGPQGLPSPPSLSGPRGNGGTEGPTKRRDGRTSQPFSMSASTTLIMLVTRRRSCVDRNHVLGSIPPCPARQHVACCKKSGLTLVPLLLGDCGEARRLDWASSHSWLCRAKRTLPRNTTQPRTTLFHARDGRAESDLPSVQSKGVTRNCWDLMRMLQEAMT